MRFVCKTWMEKAWLTASVTAFVLHRLLEVEPNGGALLWLTEAAMIALSLPFGAIAMLFIFAGVEGVSDYTDLSWLLDWSTLLFIGYIQWFWVLPEIRRNNELTILHLAAAAPPSIESASALSPDTSVTLPEIPVAFDSATFLPPLTEFDKAGLTALDKVLQAAPPAPLVSH